MKNTMNLRYFLPLFLSFFAYEIAFSQQPNWQLVQPKYATVDAVVAGYVVDPNEWGKGDKDATAYVQTLMDNLDNCTSENQRGLGGGVIYFPEGKYRFDGTLNIPKGVTLRGDWQKPVKGQPIKGTIFQVYSGRKSEDATEFIRMNSSSAVMDLAFWYPEQDPNNIVPYPATVRMQLPGGQGATFVNVKNVTLVNSYGGVWFPGGGRCPIISGVYGTPLKFGAEIDQIDDVGRVEWCDFSPAYWAGSGLPGSPSIDNANYTNWVRNNSTGVVMRKNDWSYACYITVEGYYIGYHSTHSRTVVTDVPNGHNYGLSFTNCKYGLRFESHSNFGVMFTDAKVKNCDYGIYLNYAAGEILQLYKWDIDAGENNYAIFSDRQSSAIVSLMESTVSSGKILLQGSTFLATNNEFNNAVPQIQFEANARGNLLGNHFKGSAGNLTQNVINKTNYKLEFNTTPVVAEKIPELIEVRPAMKKPSGTAFIDATKAPYNVKWAKRTEFPKDPASCKVEDATPGIQQALDQAAAQGGGVVFLRPGHYRINGSLTVPSGVELAGAANISSSPSGAGATLEIYANHNNQSGTSPVTLNENSGIRGIAFNYPRQTMCDNVNLDILADSPDHTNYDVPQYPYAIKGNGKNIYIVNVGMRATYKGADLSNCDNFYIDHLNGMFWKEGVYAKNSNNGIIANMQCNPMIYTVGDESGYGFWPNSVRNCTLTNENSPYMYDYLNFEFLILENTKNTLLYNDFNYGTLNGIVLRQGAEGTAIGFGLDNDNICILADGDNIKFDFINSQLVALESAYNDLGLGERCTYIKTTSNYGSNSKINLFSSDYGGSPGKPGVVMDGAGKLNLYVANFNQSGNQSVIEVNNGSVDVLCSQLRRSTQGNTASGSKLSNLILQGSYDRNEKGQSFAGYKYNIGPNAEMLSIDDMLDRTGWVATSNVSNNRAQNMLDGKLNTNWDCNMQNSGAGQGLVWVKVDMLTPKTFNQIILEYSSNPNDFPQSYVVEVSDDNETWDQIASGKGSSSNRTTISVEETTARYIRITKPAGTTKANYWLIAEFYVVYGEDLVMTPVLEPFEGTPIALPGTIEAENYDLGGEGIAYHDADAENKGNADFRKKEGVDVSNGSTGKVISNTVTGEWTKYTIELDRAGLYTMKSLVSSSAETFFSIEINGRNVSGNVVVPNTGGYDKYQEVVAYVQLERGVQEMTFKTSGSMNVDQFKFEKGVGYPNGYPHIVPGKIEAEAYDFGGLNVAFFDTTPKDGDSGYRSEDIVDIGSGEGSTGRFLGWTVAGEWLNYTIDVDKSGIYNVICRVSSGAGGGGSFSFAVDKTPATGDVRVPNTGGYGVYTDVNAKLYLSSGVHILTLHTNGNHNLDYFELAIDYDGEAFNGPHVIPGAIAAVDFDLGGEGKAYSDSDVENKGGNNYRDGEGVDIAEGSEGKYVGWTTPEEWLNYTVVIETSGLYSLESLVSVDENTSFSIEIDGNVVANIEVVSGSGFNSVTQSDIQLPAGQHLMTFKPNGNMRIVDFNFARQTFEYTGTPFHNEALKIPGTIEAEDFDLGGEGVAYHDTSEIIEPAEGDEPYREPTAVKLDMFYEGSDVINVAGIQAGEWLRYTVDVEENDFYDIDVYVASPNASGKFHMGLVDESGNVTPITKSVVVPNTGGWSSWGKMTIENVSLEKGLQILQISMEVGDFNLDKYVFRKHGTAIESFRIENDILIFNQLNSITVKSVNEDPIQNVAVYDLQGRIIASKTALNQTTCTLNVPDQNSFVIVKVQTNRSLKTQKLQVK